MNISTFTQFHSIDEDYSIKYTNQVEFDQLSLGLKKYT